VPYRPFKKAITPFLVPAPGQFDATVVDIYVSDSEPYWPDEKRARAANACLGPLRNDADQILTGVVLKGPSINTMPPKAALAPSPETISDRTRGIGFGIDDHGVLWICEQWMSRAALQAMRSALLTEVDTNESQHP
jgi:hypothetical protein